MKLWRFLAAVASQENSGSRSAARARLARGRISPVIASVTSDRSSRA
jgi:hypothetical protein